MTGWTPPDPRQQDAQSQAQVMLMRAFAFDALDLDANRRGRLSARQQGNQRARWRWMRMAAAVMVGVTALCLGALPDLMGDGGIGLGLAGADAVGAWMAVAMVTGLLGGSLACGYWQIRHQLTGRVHVADGLAGQPRPGRRAVTRHVTVVPVGLVEVPAIDRARLDAMAPGRAYRVYYLPGPMAEVLSVEPVVAPRGSSS